MTIRRQYSLPNCTLVLEGLDEGILGSDPNDTRPLMSILVNAECHFVGADLVLQGGRAFLENLVKVVSAYAQECLSGVRHPQETEQGSHQIHLDSFEDRALHRLTWQSDLEPHQSPVELELTTVQLFDLVEAVDQFFSDSRTLPDLSLKLQPVSRRYRQVEEPVVQRVVPATLGIASLAVAAIAFFFVPVPEVRKPETQLQSTPTQALPNRTAPALPGASPTPTKP
jgi:hypothetical protein